MGIKGSRKKKRLREQRREVEIGTIPCGDHCQHEHEHTTSPHLMDSRYHANQNPSPNPSEHRKHSERVAAGEIQAMRKYFLSPSYTSCGIDAQENEHLDTVWKWQQRERRLRSSTNASIKRTRQHHDEQAVPNVETHGTSSTPLMMSKKKFRSLRIHPELCAALEKQLQLDRATKIQTQSLAYLREPPHAIHAVLHAPTGSGKTLAYLLPLLHRCVTFQDTRTRAAEARAAASAPPPVILILVPTKELATQVAGVAHSLVSYLGGEVVTVLGGENLHKEHAQLSAPKVWVVVGTPGRTAHHVQEDLVQTQRWSWTQRVCFTVLDEADRLFEPSYALSMETILNYVSLAPQQNAAYDALLGRSSSGVGSPRQWILCSATSTRVLDTVQRHMKCPETAQNVLFVSSNIPQPIWLHSGVPVGEEPDSYTQHAKSKKLLEINETRKAGATDAVEGLLPEQLQQTYLIVPRAMRLCALYGVLKHFRRDGHKVIVFCSTCASAMYHCMLMGSVGFHDEVLMLHGHMKTRQRAATFDFFVKHPSRILFTTDVAARGLDVADLGVVVQYDPPMNPESYVHRIGRTARAGRNGRAVIFLEPSEMDFVQYLRSQGQALATENQDEGMEEAAVSQGIKISEDITLRAVLKNMNVEELQLGFEAVLEEDPIVKRVALKAYKAFLHGYPSHQLSDIFRASDMDLEDTACSFGLIDAPVVTLQKKDDAQKRACRQAGKVRSMFKKIKHTARKRGKFLQK